MKKSFPLLLLLVIVISVASCKKTSHPSNNSGSGTMLSEFVALDTTQAIGSDTLSITYFTYDNFKRVSTINWISFINYARVAGSHSTSTFFYNGTDTLCYEEISSELENPSADGHNDTNYISYDSRGRMVKIINNGANTNPVQAYSMEDDFSYVGSTIINNETSTPGSIGNGYNSQDTVTQTTSNGDVVSQVDKQNTTCTISLDNHPNPFFRNGLGVTPIYAMYSDYYDADGITDDVQKNNCTLFSVDNPVGNVNHVINQFTYNANGYPASVIQYNTFQAYQAAGPTGTLEFNFKGIYIYQ